MYTFLFNHHGNGNAQALDLADLTLRLRSLYWGFRSSGSTAVCLHLSQRQVVDDLPWSISLFWGTRGSPRPCGWRAQKWAVCFGHQSSMPVQWTCQQVPTWVLHRQPFPTWVASFSFMAAVTIYSDFGATKIKFLTAILISGCSGSLLLLSDFL